MTFIYKLSGWLLGMRYRCVMAIDNFSIGTLCDIFRRDRKRLECIGKGFARRALIKYGIPLFDVVAPGVYPVCQLPTSDGRVAISAQDSLDRMLNGALCLISSIEP